LRSAILKLEGISRMQGRWVVERQGKSARIAPVWPAPYAENFLFLGIAKIVLVSATIQEKTLELLGVGRDDFDFFDYPSSFPVARRPVIQVPSGVRVKHSWEEIEQKQWVRRMDQIIDRRLDRKGIIHTVSYERRDVVLKYTRHRDIMVINFGRDTREVVEDFKNAEPPVVLVSPSMVSGWDLPMEECEYAIIAKVPFPDSRSGVIKARTAEDANYGPYLAMLTIVQASGRGMRSADDQCEILIVDDMFEWFWRKYQSFSPRWFRPAVKRVATIPDPLPKLNLSKERLHD
jgi:Rad3-related DNA helicase